MSDPAHLIPRSEDRVGCTVSPLDPFYPMEQNKSDYMMTPCLAGTTKSVLHYDPDYFFTRDLRLLYFTYVIT
jgi:hypothetical protein